MFYITQWAHYQFFTFDCHQKNESFTETDVTAGAINEQTIFLFGQWQSLCCESTPA